MEVIENKPRPIIKTHWCVLCREDGSLEVWIMVLVDIIY